MTGTGGARRLPVELPRLHEFFASTRWYHVIDFGSGLLSRGSFDYRGHIHHFGFPEQLTGKTVLDVGAADGFFSFELERRGASVLAVDTNAFDGTPAIDPSPAHRAVYQRKYIEQHASLAQFRDVFASAGVPVGHRFMLAKSLLGSGVIYRNVSIYALGDLKTQFDLVFCGALVEHLKDPIGAVEQLPAVVKPGGLCVVTLSSVLHARVTNPTLVRILRYLGLPVVPAERGLTYNGNLSGGTFFHFYAESFRELLLASGFRDVTIYARFTMQNQSRPAMSRNHHATFHCRR